MKPYFYYGGFPENLEYKDKREYVSSIYQKILLGDIATRNGIRNYFSKFVDKETTPKYYFNDNGLLNLFLNKEEPRVL